MPRPEAVEELLGVRIDSLAGSVRRLLLAVALSGGLHTSEATAIADLTALGDGVDASVLAVGADRVRASHPLLAGVAKRRSLAADRRTLHAKLAEVVRDPRLRHRVPEVHR